MHGNLDQVAVRFRLDKVLAERERSGDQMSQSELSRRSGVSMTTINAIALNKTKQVSLATLDAICSVLHVEPGELLERDPEKRRRRSS